MEGEVWVWRYGGGRRREVWRGKEEGGMEGEGGGRYGGGRRREIWRGRRREVWRGKEEGVWRGKERGMEGKEGRVEQSELQDGALAHFLTSLGGCGLGRVWADA
jgi:hypothetical protein